MVLPHTELVGQPDEESLVLKGFEQGGKTLKGPHRKFSEKGNSEQPIKK